jgi:16S rRNA processing protein RimM
MSTPESAEEWVWLALIRRPQGRRGEVFADILTDFPEKFADRRQLWLLRGASGTVGSTSPPVKAAPVPAELIGHWLHKGGIVLHFAGVDSISAAEELNGLVVAIPRAERVPLGDDEVYIGDLIGCTLIDVTGADPTEIGVIQDVDRTAGPVALLVVKGRSGEVLVPFAKSYLRRVDTTGKRIEMVLPDGLVGLND